jgi:hypothetical protein
MIIPGGISPDFGYCVSTLRDLAFKYYGFERHLMNVIPETCCAH